VEMYVSIRHEELGVSPFFDGIPARQLCKLIPSGGIIHTDHIIVPRLDRDESQAKKVIGWNVEDPVAV